MYCFLLLAAEGSQFNPWFYIHVNVTACENNPTSDEQTEQLQGFMQRYLNYPR